MTDDEYREYLDALARKYLRLAALGRHFPEHFPGHLSYEMERLSSLARLAGLVSERSGDSSLVNTLAGELQNAYLDGIVDAMEHSGVLAALDESPQITFGELRRSAIPSEDVQFLRRAGIEDPDAEITLIIHYSRKRFEWRQQENSPSEIAHRAQSELRSAGAQVERVTSEKDTSNQTPAGNANCSMESERYWPEQSRAVAISCLPREPS